MILLLRRRLQQAKPQLDLLDVLALGAGPYVPRAGDVGGLLGAQVEEEGRLLHPLVVLRDQRGGLQQVGDYVEEGEPLELDVRVDGEVVGEDALLLVLRGVRVVLVHVLAVHGLAALEPNVEQSRKIRQESKSTEYLAQAREI